MNAAYSTLTALVDRLDTRAVAKADIIRWASPVPSFGDLSSARVATLGLNPSNREFVDESGRELDGAARRFHTLGSLGLTSWAQADARHLRSIMESCATYFAGNPYDRWFRTLDRVVSGSYVSYYPANGGGACHLDLVPYATGQKWGDLTRSQRVMLVDVSGDALALLVRDSAVQVLLLNGRSVIEHFISVFGVQLEMRAMTDWALSRVSGKDVTGFAYEGFIDELAGVDLGRSVAVLGFNHNLQSSYGITSKVIQHIRLWVASFVSSQNENATA